MIIDTHSHIYLEQFDDDRDIVMNSAKEAGISNILLPNIDSETITRLHETEDRYDVCHAMMGLHPTSVNKNYKKELDIIENHLDKRSYVGVGEIGIDLYWDKTFIREQIIAFEQQIIWAKELALPIVIHCREAFNEVFEVVDKLHDNKLTGVFHSFGGSLDDAKHIMSYQSFKLGINGVVTFKNSKLPSVLENVSPENIVIETDAPYLAPVPYRGKRNQPLYLKSILEKLSLIYHLNISELEQIVEKNSLDLFDIS